MEEDKKEMAKVLPQGGSWPHGGAGTLHAYGFGGKEDESARRAIKKPLEKISNSKSVGPTGE